MRSIVGFRAVGRLLGPAPTIINGAIAVKKHFHLNKIPKLHVQKSLKPVKNTE